MVDKTLDEMKATGEDSKNMEPVSPAGGSPKAKNRKADVNKSVDPTVDEIEDEVKTPQGPNNTGLKEAFDGLFEDTDLSEDFKVKTLAVFEAAVNEKVAEQTTTLEESFQTNLDEQVATIIEDLDAKVDSFLGYITEQWLEDNAVEIESTFKVEVAESLIESLGVLMSEHNLDTGTEIDALAEMEKRVETVESKYNESVKAAISIKEEKAAIAEERDALKREIEFAIVTEGLTDTQADKLATLAEGMSFDDVEEYTTKLTAIKESYFKESKTPTTDATEYLEEAVEEEKTKISDNPTVSGYAAALSRMAK